MLRPRHGRIARVLLIASLALAAAVPATAQQWPPQVGQLVASTKKQIRTIDMATFRARVDRGETGLLVDVREPAEYAAGYVPGAINVPRGTIEFAIWPHAGFPANLDLAKPMTLYCRTGGRCALATKSLQDLGFTNVTAVDMQFDEWVKAGHPVEKR